MSMTNTLENSLLNHIFRDATYSKPSVLAVALLTSAPDETSTGQFSVSAGTEVAASIGYSRQALNPSNSNWSDPTAGTQGEVDNSSVLTFGPATDDWGEVTHVAIVTSATHDSGSCLFYGALSASKTIETGDTFQIAVGDLNIQFD